MMWAEIDSEDEEKVSKYKWTLDKQKNTNYAKSRKGNIMLHRHIMSLENGDDRQVDHLDGNGLNNRKSNLKVTSNLENSQPWRKINTTQNQGNVYYDKRDNRKKQWESQIIIYGIRYTAYHATEQEARDYNEHLIAMAMAQADLGAT